MLHYPLWTTSENTFSTTTLILLAVFQIGTSDACAAAPTDTPKDCSHDISKTVGYNPANTMTTAWMTDENKQSYLLVSCICGTNTEQCYLGLNSDISYQNRIHTIPAGDQTTLLLTLQCTRPSSNTWLAKQPNAGSTWKVGSVNCGDVVDGFTIPEPGSPACPDCNFNIIDNLYVNSANTMTKTWKIDGNGCPYPTIACTCGSDLAQCYLGLNSGVGYINRIKTISGAVQQTISLQLRCPASQSNTWTAEQPNGVSSWQIGSVNCGDLPVALR